MLKDSMLSTIGNTPLVRLSRIEKALNLNITIWKEEDLLKRNNIFKKMNFY